MRIWHLLKPCLPVQPKRVLNWRYCLKISRICYDLRFPELYRAYAADGCDLLCNVAAFTAATGRAHWHTLLQARAIENQCFVLASAQSGMHPDGRQTWGHSMIVDPWGKVLSELADGEGVIMAELSRKRLNQVRQCMPVLQHRSL